MTALVITPDVAGVNTPISKTTTGKNLGHKERNAKKVISVG